jgi:hypothetical protein
MGCTNPAAVFVSMANMWSTCPSVPPLAPASAAARRSSRITMASGMAPLLRSLRALLDRGLRRSRPLLACENDPAMIVPSPPLVRVWLAE